MNEIVMTGMVFTCPKWASIAFISAGMTYLLAGGIFFCFCIVTLVSERRQNPPKK